MLALAAAPRGGAADPASAERLERDAEGLAASGDFLAAAAKYREAFREHPRPDLICNVGVAYYKAKDLPRAHRYLGQCVATGGSLDREFIANVKKVLAAVEQTLAAGAFKPLNFIIQPHTATTTFASGIHDESLVGSRQVYVPYGRYQVTIHAEGYRDRVLEIVADNPQPAELSVKLEPAPAEPATPTPTPTPTPAEQPLPDVPPAAPQQQRSLVAPIVASAATGAFGGLALGFYLSARSAAGDATDAARDGASLDLYTTYADRADSRERSAWIAAGATGVVAIAAGILWYRAMKTPSRVEVTATHEAAAVSIIGRW